MSYYDNRERSKRWQDFRLFTAYAALVTVLASSFAVLVMYADRYL